MHLDGLMILFDGKKKTFALKMSRNLPIQCKLRRTVSVEGLTGDIRFFDLKPGKRPYRLHGKGQVDRDDGGNGGFGRVRPKL